MTALLPTRANTFGGTKRARSEPCPQQLHCACASPTGVWRAACVPPQSERAGAKLVTVTTTTTGGQSVATSPPLPAGTDPLPRRTPPVSCHGKTRSRTRAPLVPPRSPFPRGCCALSSRSWPLELRVAEAAAPWLLACLRVRPGDGGAVAREPVSARVSEKLHLLSVLPAISRALTGARSRTGTKYRWRKYR